MFLETNPDSLYGLANQTNTTLNLNGTGYISGQVYTIVYGSDLFLMLMLGIFAWLATLTVIGIVIAWKLYHPGGE